MAIKLNADSWHYRMFKREFPYSEPPKTLCPYFWLTVALCIVTPLNMLFKWFDRMMTKIVSVFPKKPKVEKTADEWETEFLEMRKREKIKEARMEKLGKFFVGSDKVAQKFQETIEHIQKTASNINYPPFNLKKTDDNVYVIELAVAGFGKQDVELTLEDNKLVIKGQTTLDTLIDDGINVQYLHKGIADRAFTRTFSLADNVVVNNAEMINGVLKVWLEHIIPEDKKPRRINIEDKEDVSKGKKKQLLTG
jgi:molecular chaperone IbpA